MVKSRIESSVSNMFFGIINRVLLLILNFVLRTIMIRTIGVEYLGINGTLSDVISLLCMADLGFNTAMVYSFYEPLAKGDKRTVAALTNFYRRIYNTIAAVITIIGIALLPFLKYLIKTETSIPHLSILYLLTLGNAVCSYLFVYKASILTADQRDYIRVKIALVFNVIKIVLQIVLLLWLKSYMLYLVITLLTTFLSNAVATYRAVKDYPYINETHKLDRNTKKSILENMKAVFIYKASSVVLNATDNTLISMLVGTIFVGYYSNYFLLVNSLGIMMVIIYNSTTASVGNLVIMEDESARYRVFDYMQTFSFCLCSIVVPCYINLANDCIYTWLGKGFVIDTLSLIAISINFYLNSVFLPITSFREAVGLYRQTKYIMIATAVINIVLSILLSFSLGMAGVLLATPIARVLTYIWYEPMVLFNKFFKKNPRVFFGKFLINGSVVLLTTVLCNFATRLLIVENWLQWLLKACICTVICLGIILLFYSRTEGFCWTKGQVLKIIKRK